MPSSASVEVAKLVAMGFSCTAALDALRQTEYDVEAAVEKLLA